MLVNIQMGIPSWEGRWESKIQRIVSNEETELNARRNSLNSPESLKLSITAFGIRI